MQPKKKITQSLLFTSKLQQILNDQHPLYKLASSIDWQAIDKQLACCYSEDMGRPANATRLMVGLHYLKNIHTMNPMNRLSSDGLRTRTGNIFAVMSTCSINFQFIRQVWSSGVGVLELTEWKLC